MKWFFFIFNMILISVMLGLTFLAILVFRYVESAILWVVMHSCARKDKKLYSLVQKNMESHRSRNMKTSIMFSLALTFLLFSAMGFALLETMTISILGQQIGADLYIDTSG